MSAKFFAALAVCALFLFPSAALADQKPGDPRVVETRQGLLSGATDGGVSRFYGIPYAKPPVGELRFAPPEDAAPWAGTRPADGFGAQAMQQSAAAGFTFPPTPMSEDCLFLNIWAPADSKGKKLPVYVYIHGGSYAMGSGSSPKYDGTALAKNGIVAVTINYRLNGLGFLATRETHRRYGATGNWGHLDQIKALEWIRDNIAAFGGDPEQVTIAGESAGAFSVSALILSPKAAGLFRGAVLESGNILAVSTATHYARGDLDKAIAAGGELLDVFGAKDDAEGLAIMRAADAGVIAELCAFNPDFRVAPAFVTFPVFDGSVLPKDPAAALEEGRFNKVKLLFGHNTDEGSMFIPADTNLPQYKALVTRMFGAEKAKAMLERFGVDDAHPAAERARQAMMWGTFVAGMKAFADAFSAQGLDAYGYHFAYVNDADREKGMGARHTAEMVYVFDTLGAEGLKAPAELTLRDEIHRRWINFIKTGDPNQGLKTPSGVPWPKYDSKSAQVLRFSPDMGVETLPNLEDVEFMKKLMFGGQ